ncbi:hypothetical protein ABPG74_013583 [Tetrahymena malaccensis]
MGNIQEKDNRVGVKGGIFIQIDKTHFISNEVIEGFLHINLEEPFNGHLLIVQFDGIEETRFDYQVISKNKKKETKKAKETKRFLSVSMPIYDFATSGKQDSFTLMPGQWSIPFHVKIAEQLPSTIKYFKSVNHNCSIQYSLMAYILPTDLSRMPIQGNQQIFISKYMPKYHDMITRQIENSPLFSCCLTAGSYSLTCMLTQQSFAPTEIINMQIECDTKKFRKKLNKLKIELIANVQMNANVLNQKKEQIVVSKTEIQVNDYLVQTSIAVPSSIACSAEGTIIQISYEIIVTPVLDLSCLKANEPLIIPIMIIPTKKMEKIPCVEIPILNEVQKPDNWNPKILKEKKYSDQQSLKIQQLYIEFQEKQNKKLNKTFTTHLDKFEKPTMQLIQ